MLIVWQPRALSLSRALCSTKILKQKNLCQIFYACNNGLLKFIALSALLVSGFQFGASELMRHSCAGGKMRKETRTGKLWRHWQ